MAAQLPTQETTIDGMEFSVTLLNGMDGILQLNRLIRILGPGVATAFKGGVEEGGSVDLSGIGQAVAMITSALTENELEITLKKFLYATSYKDTERGGGGLLFPANFALAFQGRTSTAVKLLAFAIQANYGDFLGVLVAKGRAALAANRKPTPTTDSSSGPSGV